MHNDEDSYLGSCSIICATTYSDNSIYAQLALEGLKGKTIQDRTKSIARTIRKMGYDDPVSTNPAMVLGGLKLGVTPLGWTYAYSTLGNNGDKVSGTLAPQPGDTPVTFTEVTDKEGHVIRGGANEALHKQVIKQETAEEAKGILETVVSSGTGTKAQIGAEGQWGKTGTTENNGDAWYCGGIKDEVTACVWVGYPNSLTPMENLFEGGPVMGGTFPALIWASVISAWEELKAVHAAERASRKRGEKGGGGGTEFVPESGAEYVPEEEAYEAAPEAEGGNGGAGGGGEGGGETPAAPAEAAPEAPAEGGGGSSGGGLTAG